MLRRALIAMLSSAGLLLVAGAAGFVGLGGSTEPGATLSLALGRTAQAQTAAGMVRYHVVPEGSEVRYRVREQLVGLSFPNDAVGTSSAVEGQIVFDAQGRVLAGDSRFAVDLRTLKSDEPRRDNYLRRRTFETERYPMAVLVPLDLRSLPFPHPESGTSAFQLVSDFTVREATGRLTWDATATFERDRVTIRARTAFPFAQLALPVPRVSAVLSVEDQIRLEANLLLQRKS